MLDQIVFPWTVTVFPASFLVLLFAYAIQESKILKTHKSIQMLFSINELKFSKVVVDQGKAKVSIMMFFPSRTQTHNLCMWNALTFWAIGSWDSDGWTSVVFQVGSMYCRILFTAKCKCGKCKFLNSSPLGGSPLTSKTVWCSTVRVKIIINGPVLASLAGGNGLTCVVIKWEHAYGTLARM